MKFVNTFEVHRSQPHVTYNDYVASKRLELGKQAAALKRFYIDTNFWIRLRDVELGRNNDAAMKALLTCLERLVQSGSTICPLSYDIFLEIFSQSDLSTLLASAALIDRLSKGVCLIDQYSRIRIEITDFIRRHTRGPEGLYPVIQQIWTKTAYVVGHHYPKFIHKDLKSSGAGVVFQKAFFDQMWSMNLTDLITVSKGRFRTRRRKDISQTLTEGKLANLKDNRSFKSLFLIELSGVLDAHREDFANAAHQIYKTDTGKDLTEEEEKNDKAGNWIANLIFECFRQNKIGNYMTGLRLDAGMHALLRWDSKRKYKPTDFADLRHAAAAIPFFDYFLTERSLAHLLSDGNLRLRDYSKCVVLANPGDALHALSQIAA